MHTSNLASRASDAPAVYRIAIQGRLDPTWQAWFDGMAFSYSELEQTLLCGRVSDQAALHGMLAKIRDLGLVLVSLERQV